MRHRISALLLALLAFALAVPSGARSQSASMNGTYTYDAAASDNIETAIRDAASKLNPLIRGVARGRLRKTNEPYRRLVISHNAQQVSVVTDSRPAIVSPANGTAVAWTREDGEKLRVSTKWEGARLEQAFRAEDGQRVNSFTLSPDGRTLTMRVTVTSPRLKAPLTYNLVYRKAS
ncbi:MAG TPA: hypothetical protein VF263_01650 [Longimicrobiaceae bacterium]